MVLFLSIALVGCEGGSTCEDGICEGSITITSPAQLEALIGIVEVRGTLTIACDQCQSLDGLEDLSKISESLIIRDNPLLRSVDGLVALHSVAFSVIIRSNTSLENLTGLASLDAIGGTLMIADNDSLVSLDGLQGLTKVGYTSIAGNNSLTEVRGLGALGDYLEITGNSALLNLDGLPRSETSLSGDLVIADNESLTSIDGLLAITRVHDLKIHRNDALTRLRGLNNIFRIRRLEVVGNGSLASLDGLGSSFLTIDANMTTTEGGIRIEDNASLTDLSGLQDAIFLGRDLSIINNDALPNLVGLSRISSVEELLIMGNSSLETLDLHGLHNASLLRVVDNPALANLDGLQGMDRVYGDMEVRDTVELCDPIALRDSIGMENIGGSFPSDCRCAGIWEELNCP